ncbi:DUF7285 family protein [Halopenitus persicus]|uniref:Uncharacterized protein n=1 Tax=Halopenitus persicus TaxID=1048396 RepID=A0A1H3G5T0_9EURY|nr:hypothetical protein [Halopenitus persicus]SDX98405.1 hypothetical protein SAMN05216564_102342 [Halopenitus persicus]
MSRSSADRRDTTAVQGRVDTSSDRGQTEPIAALVALLAVGAGLTMYAGVIADADPGTQPRETAGIVLDRVEDRVVVAGVAHPDRLRVPNDVGVDRRRVAIERRRIGVAMVTADRRWLAGDRNATRPLPAGTTVARRSVSVRIAPGEQVRGELRVVVGR